ncbi:MAG: ABC transporter substrate-binding protein [Janthinobacterium sp.]|jgi:branched-chain amino acid transport system substrate-binding protein
MDMQAKRRFIPAAIIALVVVVIVGGVYFTKKPAGTEVIKIGAILPFTGTNAIYGEAQSNGINLAIDEINKNGGVKGKQLQMVYQDSQSDATKAVSAANSLLVDKSIKLLFSSMTPTTIPVLPLLKDDNRILMITGSIHPELAKQSKYFFKDNADVYDWANTISNSIIEKKLTKTALVVFKTEQGELFINEFSKSITPVVLEKYATTDTDYRTIALKVKEAGADSVVFVGFPKNDNIFLKNLEELNVIKPTWVINGVWPEVTAGGVGNLIQPYSAWYSFKLDSQEPATKKFVADYRAKYQKDPNNESAFLYDDVKIFADAIGKCDVDTDCISKSISSLKDYHGVAGSVSFNEKRNSVRESTLFQFTNGKWAEVVK